MGAALAVPPASRTFLLQGRNWIALTGGGSEQTRPRAKHTLVQADGHGSLQGSCGLAVGKKGGCGQEGGPGAGNCLPTPPVKRSVQQCHGKFGLHCLLPSFFFFKFKFTTTLYILFLLLEVKFLTSLARAHCPCPLWEGMEGPRIEMQCLFHSENNETSKYSH